MKNNPFFAMPVYFPLVLSLLVGEVWAHGRPLALDALTLEDCYRRALARSEAGGISQQEVARAEALAQEARSRIMSRAGVRASEKIQDTSGATGSDRRGDRPEAALYVKQPLFHGFREFALLRAQRADADSRRFEIDRLRAVLFEDVADVFYGLIAEEGKMATLDSILKSLREREAELLRRESIGRSRHSEVLASQTQSALIAATLEDARTRRELWALALGSLLGLEAVAVQDQRIDPETAAPPSQGDAAGGNRPDVRAAEQTLRAMEFLERAARRALWPSVDVDGVYYLKRVGSNAPVDWEAQVSMDFLFYRGGEYRAQVARAQADRRAQEIRVSRVRREARLDIESRQRELEGAIARRRRLEEAARLARESDQAQRVDYRLGLVTNLDVLAALQVREETELEFDRARWETRRLAARRDAALFLLPEETSP